MMKMWTRERAGKGEGGRGWRGWLWGLVGLPTVVGAVGWMVVLGAVQVWCQSRLSDLPYPKPRRVGELIEPERGQHWISYSERYWWGEANQVFWNAGLKKSSLPRPSEGLSSYPRFAGSELLHDMHEQKKYDGQFVLLVRSSGFPWRTWLIVREMDMRQQRSNVRAEREGVYWRGVALTVLTAWVLGWGTGLGVGAAYRGVAGRVRRGRGMCAGCGYDVRGLGGMAGAVCPECGRGLG